MKTLMFQIANPPFIFTIGIHLPLEIYDEDSSKYNYIFNKFHFIKTNKALVM